MKSNGKSRTKETLVSPLRLWIFRFTAVVVIPILAFLLAEVGLRMAGYGYPAGSIVKQELNGKSYCCDNVKFSWRFFPPPIARSAEPFIFPAKKANGTVRIFVLGASAAMGMPNTESSLGRVLEVMLRHEYPDVSFEIVTVAMAAINSHVVQLIAKDCARYEPDLFVVYLGNNEVTGPYGAGTVFQPLSGSLTVIRAGIAFKGTKLGQLFSNLLHSIRLGGRGPQRWRALEMFLDNQVRLEDTDLQTVYDHYQSNLETIARAGRAGGAKVVFCTVASNLRHCPPFGSLHRRDLSEAEKQEWDRLYGEGVRFEDDAKHAEAVDRYLAAADIDDRYADLQFRLGRCYWQMGEYDRAKERYISARELDTLRFRADNGINAAIRDVAGRGGKGVHLVDTVAVFARNSSHGVTGGELLHEHVHLNFKGTYLLAREVLRCTTGALGGGVLPPRQSMPAMLSEDERARQLVYTEWNLYKGFKEVVEFFLSRPPFTEQLYHHEQIALMNRALDGLEKALTPGRLDEISDMYREAVEQDRADWHLRYRYGQFLGEALGDYEAAAEQFRWVQEHFPHSYTGYGALGDVLRVKGDLQGAVAQYHKVVQINPAQVTSHYFLASLYFKLGMTKKAEEYYVKSIKLQPAGIRAYYELGQLLHRAGRTDEAVEILRRGLRFVPESVALHSALGALLSARGRTDEAVTQFEAALRIDPNSGQIREALEAVRKGEK